jgi:TetR/AcrR family transcriptional regulator
VRTGRPRARARATVRDPREEIIAVASHLFARRGVAATRMSEIAEGAGLQQSSIYYYFRNKEEILGEIVATVNRVPLAHLARIDVEGGSPGLRLFRLVRFDVVTLCAFPYDINEVHRISAQAPVAFAEYWAERQALNDGVERIVAEGVAEEELRPVDARLAALTILANDEAVQNWYRPVGDRRLRGREGPEGDYRPEEIALHLARTCLEGLLVDRRRLPTIARRAAELG